jgi:diguanylate cyclase (GGDEF)-like protein
MKVLVCDDSIVNRQIIGAYLRQMGHEALFAENGTQAVELFGSEKPDLVLIDVEMPTMDGYEATRAMRQTLYDFSQWTPIIFISSHVDDASIVKGIEAGGDDYLTKPVSLSVLRAKIHAMRRLVKMRENLMDFGNQLRDVNEKLMVSNQLLAELSLKDPLTRLGNRRAFEENLSRICKTAMREFKPVSLLMIDVDNFKQFNDTYGHQAGDRCLQQVSQVLKLGGLQRGSDFAARYGGEEFAIVLFDTNLQGSIIVAERIRLGVEALQIPHKNSLFGVVTISLGVASSSPDKEFVSESLIRAADSALYEAKANGRNRVVGSKLPVDMNKPEPEKDYTSKRHLPPAR